jgi:alkylation response protein AidB-like acyl-CoA dehydrogenase
VTATAVKDLRAVAESLVAGIEAGVQRDHDIDGIPPETLSALHGSGLLRMRVPAEVGGGGADARTIYDVVERFSEVDGATGWTFMAGSSLLGLASAYCADRAVEQILSDPLSCIAGQVAPRGRADRSADGLRVQGEFGFGSGAGHSNYLFGGFREFSDGEPVRIANGLPNVLIGVVDRANVEYLGNWNVLGLQGTGSVDYRVLPHVIDPGFTWPMFTAEPLRGGALYRMGIFGLTAIDHSAFSIGVARRALSDLRELATAKKRVGRPRLVDDPVFQFQYAQAEASLCAARAFVLEAVGELERAATADRVTRNLKARARLAATHAARTAIAVTQTCYQFSGSTGLRRGSAMQQCLRDLVASEAHVFTDHNSWRDIAVELLGVAPDNLFL